MTRPRLCRWHDLPDGKVLYIPPFGTATPISRSDADAMAKSGHAADGICTECKDKLLQEVSVVR